MRRENEAVDRQRIPASGLGKPLDAVINQPVDAAHHREVEAVQAAQQYTNTTVTTAPTVNGLLLSQTQLDISGNGGTASSQSVRLFNTSRSSTTVIS